MPDCPIRNCMAACAHAHVLRLRLRARHCRSTPDGAGRCTFFWGKLDVSPVLAWLQARANRKLQHALLPDLNQRGFLGQFPGPRAVCPSWGITQDLLSAAAEQGSNSEILKNNACPSKMKKCGVGICMQRLFQTVELTLPTLAPGDEEELLV